MWFLTEKVFVLVIVILLVIAVIRPLNGDYDYE